MAPDIGLALIALLVTALILVHGSIRKDKLRRRRSRRGGKHAQSHLSVRTEMRSMEDAYSVMGPTTMLEVCDNIPTVDQHGIRRTVIRTRTLETVLGPVGPTEVERNAGYTLPGYGLVTRESETEFVTFRDHIKLRLYVTGDGS